MASRNVAQRATRSRGDARQRARAAHRQDRLSLGGSERIAPGGVRGRRGTAGQVELAEDVRHVAVSRVLAHHEPFADLPVGEPFGDQGEDQRELDQLKLNGQLELLYQEIMQTNSAPGILQVFTEQYPPLTFRNSYGEISGFGTDVVNEIMRRNQRFYDIRLTLWSNAYQQALLNPNFCLFTMDRTPIRENLFRWVGPIGTNATHFYVKNGSGISIGTVDEARSLNAIGTVASWFSDQYLRELGFTNLVAAGDPTEMVNLLMNGQVQAIVCTNITIADIVRQAGFAYEQLQPETTLLSSDYYIAFSRSTDDDIVTQWQTSLEAAKTDGTYAAILRKWFPIE